MKNQILGILIALFSGSAFALPNPCAPTVKLSPFHMNCKGSANETISIDIETIASPINEQCPYESRQEIQTAILSYYNLQTLEKVSELKIFDGSFELDLQAINKIGFKSPRHKLNLKNCVAPLHGGVSLGN